MSFDYPQQQPRRRKGGMGGIFMMLIIGAVIFFFMQSRGPSTGNDESDVTNPAERRVDDSRVDRVLREADEYRRQRADVLGSPNSNDAGKAMPQADSRNKGGWSIEDVDGNAKAATKTKGEDGWSIEDVPTKEKSGTGFNLNNPSSGEAAPAEKSDWSLEDVDSKAKKTTEGEDGWSIEEVGGKGGK